jgi:hypothetical protein
MFSDGAFMRERFRAKKLIDEIGGSRCDSDHGQAGKITGELIWFIQPKILTGLIDLLRWREPCISERIAGPAPSILLSLEVGIAGIPAEQISSRFEFPFARVHYRIN